VIERNASLEERTPSSSEKNGKNHKKKHKNENGSTEHPKGDRFNNKSFYCSEHGKNPMHATADCFTLKSRDKSGLQGANHSFSNKSFRKEVNFLAKKSSKKKVLDMYATAIKREQKKMQKQIAKHKPREVASSDSESSSEVSMHNIEHPKSRKSSTKSKTRTDERTLKSVARKKCTQKAETLQEEAAYQKKVQWLADHGESDKDEPVDGQSDTDTTGS
jgi:hypothetical protein